VTVRRAVGFSSAPLRLADPAVIRTLAIISLVVNSLLLAPATQATQLVFTHLTVDDGLPENSVRAILQDEVGFLWFGTQNGLARYDGYEMVDRWHRGEDGVPRFFVTSLLEDREGNVWIGTLTNGIWRLDPRTETCEEIMASPGPPLTGRSQQAPHIVQDPGGVIWVAWNGYGLCRILPASGEVLWYRNELADNLAIPSNQLSAVLPDRHGQLWIGTEDEGIFVLDPETGVVRHHFHVADDPHSILSNVVTNIYETPDGRVWVSTFDGLALWMPQHRGFRNFVPNPEESQEWVNYLLQIAEGEGGVLWIGSAVGLYRFDSRDGSFRLFAHDPADPRSPVKGPVLSVCRDRSGIVWAGSWHAGLNKLDPGAQKFSYVAHDPGDPHSLDDDAVMAVCEDTDGILWVGTGSMSTGGSAGGLNRLDPGTGGFDRMVFAPQPEGVVRSVQSLAADRAGRLWVGTNMGLWRMDRGGSRPVRAFRDPTHERGIGGVPVRALAVDGENVLWVGTFRFGLYRIDLATGELIRFRNDPDDPRSLSQDQIICLEPDIDGRLWVGTDSRGLDHFDPRKNEFRNFYDPRVGITSMIDIHEDPRGRLWLATYSGLLRFHPEHGVVASFTTQNGLPHDVVSSILEDDVGRLWISTGRGLARVDPATGDVRTYDVRDGLPSNELYFAHTRRRDGEMVIGSHHGLVRFRPQLIRDNVFVPPVVLTELRIADEIIQPGAGSPLGASLPYATGIELRHDQNDIAFAFAALHFSHPHRNSYRCRLAPYDRDWREIDHRRSVTYTNLDPGSYVFEVQGTNADGIWNEEGASLAVAILPPWWQTGVAYAVYLGLAGLLFLLIYRQVVQRERMRAALTLERGKARQLAELDELKSRFFANISHEFRTPLTLIQAPLQHMLAESQDEDGIVAMMARNARRLGQLIDQLLDLSRLESGRMPLHWRRGDWAGPLRVLVASFDSQAEARGLGLVSHVPDSAEPVWHDPDLLEKVIGNLLANACKYTPEGGTITVEVELSDEATPVAPPGNGGGHGVGTPVPARQLTVVVANSDAYIPAEDRERIFDRFHRLAEAGDSGGEIGSGLGLALVNELVNLLGGEISVDSSPDIGTRFVVRLPLFLEPPDPSLQETDISVLARPDEMPAASAPAAEMSAIAESLLAEADDAVLQPAQDEAQDDQPVILVVEDNADLRNFLGSELRSLYRVFEAKDGDEGLRLALAEVPDLVLSDVMMPGIDGFELCSRLKEDERTSHIPVVLLTARTESESRRHGLRIGADDYLAKPFDREELRIRIENLISMRRRLAEKYARQVATVAPQAMPVDSADDRFLRRAREVVAEHLEDEDFTVEVFCREVGMSRSQVHRKLKALIGQSTSEFVRTHRLQRAAELLAGGYGSVTEVAYAVGFQSLSYFARCFREQHGVPPSEYPAK